MPNSIFESEHNGFEDGRAAAESGQGTAAEVIIDAFLEAGHYDPPSDPQEAIAYNDDWMAGHDSVSNK